MFVIDGWGGTNVCGLFAFGEELNACTKFDEANLYVTSFSLTVCKIKQYRQEIYYDSSTTRKQQQEQQEHLYFCHEHNETYLKYITNGNKIESTCYQVSLVQLSVRSMIVCLSAQFHCATATVNLV